MWYSPLNLKKVKEYKNNTPLTSQLYASQSFKRNLKNDYLLYITLLLNDSLALYNLTKYIP